VERAYHRRLAGGSSAGRERDYLLDRLKLPRSRRTACGGSRSPLDANCGTKMEPNGGTICARSRSASRSSTRAKFASWARKPNCYGHLPSLRE
jgi:hypothetical protein